MKTYIKYKWIRNTLQFLNTNFKQPIIIMAHLLVEKALIYINQLKNSFGVIYTIIYACL